MTHYRWNDTSPIASAELNTAHTAPQLILCPGVHADASTLATLPRKLADQGWFSVPDSTPEGDPILRVYGFRDPQKVVEFLGKEKFTEGLAALTDTGASLKKKKKDTLISSGWLYLAGDTFGLLGGHFMGNKDISIGNAIKALSSGILIYGRTVNPDNPLHSFIKKTTKELKARGVDVRRYKDADLLSNQLEKSPSFKKKFDKFLSDYSVETLIGINTLGDVFFAKSEGKGKSPTNENSGKKKKHGLKQQGMIGLATSANLFIARLFVENRHRMKPGSTIFKLTNILEKTALPIRALGNIAGNLFTIRNTFLNCQNLWRDAPFSQMNKANKRDFLGNLMLATTSLLFLTANIQYGRGKQKKQMPFAMEDASAALANVFQDLPGEHRLKAVDEAATFFATQDPKSRPVEEHKKILFDKIEKLKDSPFLQQERMQVAYKASPSQSMAKGA